MAAFLSEWGKILATASSYERAHFFGNVAHEVAIAKGAFQFIGSKMTSVTSGEHVGAMYLTAITLVCTAAFMLLMPAVVSASGLELVTVMFYVVMYIGSLDVYAL